MFIYWARVISANVCVLLGSVPPPLSQGMRMVWCQAVRITSCHMLWLWRWEGDSRGTGGRTDQVGEGEALSGDSVSEAHWGGKYSREERRRVNSPEARHHAAQEEHTVALDKGGEEGEEAVDRHGYQQALFTAHFVWQAAPKKGSKHHPQIHNAAWKQEGREGGRGRQKGT